MSKKANKKQSNVTKQAKQQSVVKLVKASENNLKSFLNNVSEIVSNKAKEVDKLRNTHAYKTKTTYKKSNVAKLSRRAYIIKMLHENKHTKADIVNALIATYDIADKSNNLKAVSGTIYDISSNSSCNIKIDNETAICSCLTANCKHAKN
jgi:hypothetical protein